MYFSMVKFVKSTNTTALHFPVAFWSSSEEVVVRPLRDVFDVEASGGHVGGH